MTHKKGDHSDDFQDTEPCDCDLAHPQPKEPQQESWDIQKLIEAVTDYGYNDEYGYYSDWADGVRPILQSFIEKLLTQEKERAWKEGMKENSEELMPYIEKLQKELAQAKELGRKEEGIRIKKIVEGIEEFGETYCEKDEHLLNMIKTQLLGEVEK